MEEVVGLWVAAAAAHGAATEAGDHRTANTRAPVIVAALAELRRRGADAKARVLVLLEHPEPGVQASAAAEALAFAPEPAAEVLAALAEAPNSLVAFTAGHVLREWQRGARQPEPWADDAAPAS